MAVLLLLLLIHGRFERISAASKVVAQVRSASPVPDELRKMREDNEADRSLRQRSKAILKPHFGSRRLDSTHCECGSVKRPSGKHEAPLVALYKHMVS